MWRGGRQRPGRPCRLCWGKAGGRGALPFPRDKLQQKPPWAEARTKTGRSRAGGAGRGGGECHRAPLLASSLTLSSSHAEAHGPPGLPTPPPSAAGGFVSGPASRRGCSYRFTQSPKHREFYSREGPSRRTSTLRASPRGLRSGGQHPGCRVACTVHPYPTQRWWQKPL